MIKPRILSGLPVFLLTAAAATMLPSLAIGDVPPTTQTPTDAPIMSNKKATLDLKHPPHMGEDHYPKESIKKREQGTCYLTFLIQADGSVPAAQLLKSSGYPRLDIACFEAFIDVPMLPAIVDGVPVTSWLINPMPLAWVLVPPPSNRPPPLEKNAAPRIADGYALHVGKEFYPDSMKTGHPKGYCVVHVVVDTTGTVRDTRLTHSAGSKLMDKACIDALASAKFTPELQNGAPVEDSTDIAIYW
jgi:TonB family protein